jgi:hypothetical protein
MRDNIIFPILLLLGLASSARLDPVILPFGQPLAEEQYYIDNTTTSPDFELKLAKRQSNGCTSGYANCATLGAAGLCCKTTEVCAQDSSGNVACCQTQATCTGTIRPATTGGTNTAAGGSSASTSIVVVGGAGATTTTASTTTGGSVATIGSSGTSTGIVFVGASGATSGAQQTSGASRSYVNNPYYPYAFIPTTYADAAACSSAYTTCHADYSACSSYLAGAPSAHGVTVSVSGGGGTTVVQSVAPTTYAADFASSVCASLSGSACYGLTVAACAAFGSATAAGNGAAAARCTGVGYAAGLGAGIAMGVMGYR